MKDPFIVLLIALFLATLGMVLVVLGTLHGALLKPGTILLALGFLGAAAAGTWRSIQSK